MTSIILKRDTAFSACGSWAGITIVSPACKRTDSLEINISASPSRTNTIASNGAVCSPFVKGEKGDRAGFLLQYHFADNHPPLIFDLIQQNRRFTFLFHAAPFLSPDAFEDNTARSSLTNPACPGTIFSRAASGLNQPTRSISGISMRRPDRGGHSTQHVLL